MEIVSLLAKMPLVLDVVEEIQPMIHFDKDSEISHLVMDILCSMALEVIPVEV
jgi:hypothetical protein